MVAQPGHQRQQVDIVGADHQLVRVALGQLQVEEGFGAVAAALVQHHGVDVEQLVLADRRLDQAGELVGAATGTAGDDDLQVLFGFPGSRQGGQGGAAEQGASGQEGGDGARICGTHGGPLVVIVVMGRAECAKRTDKRPLKIRHTPIAWGYEWKRMSDTWSDNRRKWPYEQL
ncbi:Uncharacterised protein [Acinetobacter baumannii]|nr:Uncharacterised protein [Acinetobacter baumannii]